MTSHLSGQRDMRIVIFGKAIKPAVQDMYDRLNAELERNKSRIQPTEQELLWKRRLERLMNEQLPNWLNGDLYRMELVSLPWDCIRTIVQHAKTFWQPEVKSIPPGRKMTDELEEIWRLVNYFPEMLKKDGYDALPFPMALPPSAPDAAQVPDTKHSEGEPALRVGRTEESALTPPEWLRTLPDEKLRKIVTTAWDEAERAAKAGLPMASTVMRGAVLEAALITLLERDLPDTHPKKKNLRKDRLEDLVNTARSAGVLSELAANCADCARITRNLIHPFRLVEKSEDIEEIAALPKLMEAWTEAAAKKLEAGK